jgi:hypothetical protein
VKEERFNAACAWSDNIVWYGVLKAVCFFWSYGGDSRSCERDRSSEVEIMEVAMAKVIEFYIPKNFRKPMNSVRELQRGRILEFRTQTRKSA